MICLYEYWWNDWLTLSLHFFSWCPVWISLRSSALSASGSLRYYDIIAWLWYHSSSLDHSLDDELWYHSYQLGVPRKDILTYPAIPWDIQTSGYLKDIFCGYQRIYCWIWKDIQYMSINIQPLSMDLSCSLSFHIQLHSIISTEIHSYHRYPQWYPTIYPFISIY